MQMHKKHEPCKDTTHLGTEDFLKHLQSLPSYANQARCLGSTCSVLPRMADIVEHKDAV